jgi:hypothetical protein
LERSRVSRRAASVRTPASASVRSSADEGVYDECGSRGAAAGASRGPDRNQDSISEGAHASLPKRLCSGNGDVTWCK